MPYKNHEDQLAYQRKWYAEHRERVIAKVRHRKRTLYAGVCVVCGAATVGTTKGKASRFCKDHKKELWEEKKSG